MALKRNIPEEYMDYDYGFTGVSEEEYRKKETEADLKVSQAEKDAAQKLREASLKINKEYIYWPDRKEQVEGQIDKLLGYTRD